MDWTWTMDRFFVNKNNIDLEKNTCIIDGEDVKHITKVLRYREGEKIEICDGEDNEYIGEIISMSKEEVNLNIIDKRNIKREANLKVRIYQGMPKGPKMEYILQKLTEVGTDEITLVDTKRSVAKIDNKKEDKKFERWERIIYEAAKQSKRGKIPKLKGILSFKEALEDMQRNEYNICPYEDEKNTPLVKEIRGLNIESIGIFIGPEGGIAEEEIDALKENGSKIVTLGPRILRTETASTIASALVQYELGDLGGEI